VKGEIMGCLLKRAASVCGVLLFLTGYLKADHDASLPDTYIQNKVVNNGYELLGVTPPLIGSFAAPDSEMRGLAFDGQYLWAANSGDGYSNFGPKIYRLDPDSGTVVNSYNSIIDYPCGLAWDGQYLWHSTFVAGMIFQIDAATMTVIKSFAAPSTNPFDLAWDGTFLYAALGNDSVISVIDTSNGAVIDTIRATYSSANVRPFGLTSVKRGVWQLWTSVGNYGSNTVNLWNLHTGAWVDQWAGDPTTYPAGLAYDSLSERLWMSCYERDSIYIFDVSQVGITTTEVEGISGFEIEARPNPFSHSTRIRFSILDSRYSIEHAKQNISGSVGRASEYQNPGLRIYDATGRAVKFFSLPTTYYLLPTVITWDGSDINNQQLPPGVYFLKLQSEKGSVKLVKLK